MRIFNYIVSVLKRCPKFYYGFLGALNKQAAVCVGGMRFSAPSALCEWRAQTIFKKEPETIRWIDGFDSTDIFWDIGANVGIYSIYAAHRHNMMVYAFEPSPFNFSVLSKNIYLNRLSENIAAFCLALSDQTRIGPLNLKSIQEGAAHTSFHSTKNEFGENFLPEYSQLTMGVTADDFLRLFDLMPPNHIKIDVDGAEKLVIKGASEILKNPALKSLLIELNSQLNSEEERLFDMIVSHGFCLERADHPDGDERLSNYIFKRK